MTRLGAVFVDGLCVAAPAVAMLSSVVIVGTDGLVAAVIATAAILVGLVAQLWAQLGWGQTIGKRLFGIRVVRTNGEPVGLWRLLLLRNLPLSVASRLFKPIGLVDALLIFGAERRCLHDYLADTMVVESGKAKPASSGDHGAPREPRG